MRFPRRGIVVALAVAVGVIGPQRARADDRAFDPDTSPFGASYSEWAASWWQWVISLPVSTNPLLSDPTGEHCSAGQTGGPVWFLAGNKGTKSCTIPSTNAILVNAISFVYCAFADDVPVGTRSIGFVRSVVGSSGVAQSTGVTVSVDGKPVGGITNFLVSSPIFAIDKIPAPPSEAFFGASDANLPFSCAAQGWFVLLKPLSPGPHTIHYAADNPHLQTDVTFDIIITP
jgi:hypothetical protein